MERPEITELEFIKFIEETETGPFKKKYSTAIDDMVKRKKHSILVNFNDLKYYNNDLALKLLDNPRYYLSQFRKAVFSYLKKRYVGYTNKTRYIFVRVSNLPSLIPLSDLGSDYIGKFLNVKGYITRVGSIRPMVLKSTFRCTACGELYHGMENICEKPPKECVFCRCRSFELDEHESVFVDSQWVSIQDIVPYSKLKVDVLLKGDITNKTSLNKKVSVNGFLELIRKEPQQINACFYDYYLYANFIDGIIV